MPRASLLLTRRLVLALRARRRRCGVLGGAPAPRPLDSVGGPRVPSSSPLLRRRAVMTFFLGWRQGRTLGGSVAPLWCRSDVRRLLSWGMAWGRCASLGSGAVLPPAACVFSMLLPQAAGRSALMAAGRLGARRLALARPAAMSPKTHFWRPRPSPSFSACVLCVR